MAKAASSGHTIPIWVLRVFLGLAFLTIGGAKLTGSLGMVGWFAQIGWGQWFRYLTGLLDIIGALLLFLPRWTFYGSLVLACAIGTATVLTIALPLHQNPAVPLTLTSLAVTLAWLTRTRTPLR
jgi:uncharacterized membrane protein YphA (DoxX/SURF4 family)